MYIHFAVSDAICRLLTFSLDSRLFYTRLSIFLVSTLDFLVSTLDFYSRLSTFSLDSLQLLSTLDIYSRLSTLDF